MKNKIKTLKKKKVIRKPTDKKIIINTIKDEKLS